MVVKVFISGISGNKEVKKRQQRVLMILDSKNIKYDVIDITEPGRESDKDFMQSNAKSNGGTVSDPNPRSPLPPQLFSDDEYCGDYDQFDLANEIDTLEQFLKLEVPPEQPEPVENEEKTLNGDASKGNSKENSQERDATDKTAETEKEKSPVTEKTASREGTPASKAASKEPTPARDDADESKVPKESSTERQTSVEKENSPAKDTTLNKPEVPSKEASPVKESVTENGTANSRDHSVEKQAAGDAEPEVDRKKDVSELLIESEQTASAE